MKWNPRRPSPAAITIWTAAVTILLLLSVHRLSTRRNHFTALVEIGSPVVENASAAPKTLAAAPRLPDGEVERTAVRVREVSALVIGLTLFVVNEGLNRRSILNVGALIGRFVARGLLPPGVELRDANGILSSSHALIYIRYRPDPLAVEIISLGRERQDGPAVIGRIVTGEEENADAGIFISRELGNVSLPAPFAPSAQIAAMGWSVEPLRQRSLAMDEWDQINAWLQAQGR